MGILQSVLQSLGFETDEEESSISTNNLTPREKWEHALLHDLASQMKYLTVSVPDLRASSSHTYTSVNDNSVGFAKENVPPNGGRTDGRQRRDDIPVVVKGMEGRWIKHYSSCHRILLVGEGDFSFSTCLASAFGRASNMVATSLDSRGIYMVAVIVGLCYMLDLHRWYLCSFFGEELWECAVQFGGIKHKGVQGDAWDQCN